MTSFIAIHTHLSDARKAFSGIDGVEVITPIKFFTTYFSDTPRIGIDNYDNDRDITIVVAHSLQSEEEARNVIDSTGLDVAPVTFETLANDQEKMDVAERIEKELIDHNDTITTMRDIDISFRLTSAFEDPDSGDVVVTPEVIDSAGSLISVVMPPQFAFNAFFFPDDMGTKDTDEASVYYQSIAFRAEADFLDDRTQPHGDYAPVVAVTPKGRYLVATDPIPFCMVEGMCPGYFFTTSNSTSAISENEDSLKVAGWRINSDGIDGLSATATKNILTQEKYGDLLDFINSVPLDTSYTGTTESFSPQIPFLPAAATQELALNIAQTIAHDLGIDDEDEDGDL